MTTIEDFRPMSDKQLKYMIWLDEINKEGAERETLSQAAERLRDKVSSKLASKIINHLKGWSDLLRNTSRGGAFSDCMYFIDKREELTKELEAL